MFAFPVSDMSLKKPYLDVLALQIYYTAHFDPVVLFAPRLPTEDIITQGIRMSRSDVVSTYEYSYAFLPGTPERKLKPSEVERKGTKPAQSELGFTVKSTEFKKRQKNQ